MGDVLATGFWAARISEITEEDTVLIIGAGPTGICALLCVMLNDPAELHATLDFIASRWGDESPAAEGIYGL